MQAEAIKIDAGWNKKDELKFQYRAAVGFWWRQLFVAQLGLIPRLRKNFLVEPTEIDQKRKIVFSLTLFGCSLKY